MTFPIEDAIALHKNHGGNLTYREIGNRYALSMDAVRGRIRRYLARNGSSYPNGIEMPQSGAEGQIGALTEQRPTTYQDYPALLDNTLDWESWKTKRTNSLDVAIACWYDLHIPDQDEQALRMALDILFVMKEKGNPPEVVVFGGDVFEFDLLGNWPVHPTRIPADPFTEIENSWNRIIDNLLRQHPGLKIIMFDGNHEKRRETFQAKAFPLFYETLEARYRQIVSSHGRVWYLPRTHETEIGHLFIKHGKRYGQYAAKNTLEDEGGAVPVVQGHVHRPQSWIKRVNLPGGKYRVVQAMASGCLCKIPPSYENGETRSSKWAHGIVIAHVNLMSEDVYLQNVVFQPRGQGLYAFYGGTEVSV